MSERDALTRQLYGQLENAPTTSVGAFVFHHYRARLDVNFFFG
jgi:hypothetical protein